MSDCSAALIAGLPPIWHDCTDWASILHLDATQLLYFNREAKHMSNIERISRAVSGAHMAQTIDTKAGFVYRAGPVAANGLKAFVRLMHAAAAANLMQNIAQSQPLLSRGNIPLIGRVYKHVLAGLPWAHGSTVCPPQLRPQFVARVKCCMYAMAYATASVRAPNPNMSRQEIKRNVAWLQMLCAAASTHFSSVQRWAELRLKVEVANGWGIFQADLRPHVTHRRISDEHKCAIMEVIATALGRSETPSSVANVLALMQLSVQHRRDAIDCEKEIIHSGLGWYLCPSVTTDFHVRCCPVRHVERSGSYCPLAFAVQLPRGPF